MTRQLDTKTAQEIGRKGGQSTSEKKKAASKRNGALGGRPKKEGTK